MRFYEYKNIIYNILIQVPRPVVPCAIIIKPIINAQVIRVSENKIIFVQGL